MAVAVRNALLVLLEGVERPALRSGEDLAEVGIDGHDRRARALPAPEDNDRRNEKSCSWTCSCFAMNVPRGNRAPGPAAEIGGRNDSHALPADLHLRFEHAVMPIVHGNAQEPGKPLLPRDANKGADGV